MRTAEVKIYSFDELSDEAKERAHANWLNKGHEHFWAGEARDTIKAFESEFGVTIRNWRYDSSGYGYDIRFDGISDEVLELSGNRARAWIWNNLREDRRQANRGSWRELRPLPLQGIL